MDFSTLFLVSDTGVLLIVKDFSITISWFQNLFFVNILFDGDSLANSACTLSFST